MENLVIDILEITIPVSIFIVILLLCAPILKRGFVSKWRYCMWLFVAIRLILPLRLNIAGFVTLTVPVGPNAAAAGYQTAAWASLPRLITVIWLVGAVIFAAYQTACYLAFSKIVRRWSRQITDKRILAAARQAAASAGVKRNFKIKYCRAVSTPMIFGIFKPALLLPDIDFTDTELSIILRHELVHMKRHDIWYKLLIMAARTEHWFNPLVHLMARAADTDMELACDAEVVRNQSSAYRRGYCETIMRLVHNCRGRGTALSTCFFFSKRTVLERFHEILDERIKRRGALTFCIIAVSVAVSGEAITFAADGIAGVIEDEFKIAEQSADAPIPSPAEETGAAENVGPAEEQYSDEDDFGYRTIDDYGAAESYSGESDSPAAYSYESDGDEPEYYPPKSEYDSYHTDYAEETGSDLTELQSAPDYVSEDGSRETYLLDDGSTAIVRYDGDIPDTGYILVK